MNAVRPWPVIDIAWSESEAPNALFLPLTMSGLTKAAPALKPFTLALIQLGNIGANKADNLKHAREMIEKAVTNHGESKRPDLVVLPVCTRSVGYLRGVMNGMALRNALILRTG